MSRYLKSIQTIFIDGINTQIQTSSNKLNHLYCDGAFNKLSSPYGWSSVVNQDGQDVLHEYLPIIKYNQMNIKRNIEVNLHVQKITSIRDIIEVKFTGVKQQINGAELIAMLLALKIANHYNTTKKDRLKLIKCDSSTIISWCNGVCHLKSGCKDSGGVDKLEYIKQLQTEFNIFKNAGGVIQKITGGDNLADLGYHKH
jgi:ribonuclease HI